VLALKREIQDLKDSGYKPEAMDEFIRDTIANINGIYYVHSVIVPD
jgi:CRISPR/Cas system-associated protein Csm6